MKAKYTLLIAVLVAVLIVPATSSLSIENKPACLRSCGQYPIMHPDSETLFQWLECYNDTPSVHIDLALEPPTGSLSLLSHLEYDPVERDQGSCGNCWAWAGTGILEVALDVQEGIKDRLSIQYLNSKYNGGTGPDWACCGGWLEYLADFYTSEGFAIPWSNINAAWADGTQTCADGTSVSWETISTSPNYPINMCTAESIQTHGVGQTSAKNNIKNVLAQGKAVWFGFFLPTATDWQQFFDFWNYQPEDAIWNPDYSCGHVWDDGGGGHAVLCVGYNDTDPDNSYWIMVNSWGTAGGSRPNGIFHLDMNMDYDCYFYYPWPYAYYSFYWETLDITFDVSEGPPIHNIVQPPPNKGIVSSGDTVVLPFGATFTDSTQSIATFFINHTVDVWTYDGFEAYMDSVNVTSQFVESYDPTAGVIRLNCSAITPANGSLNMSVIFTAGEVEGNHSFSWRYVFAAFQPPPEVPYVEDENGTTYAYVQKALCFTIHLVQGWNLIGLPLLPENTTVETIFAGNLTYVETIYGYKNETWFWFIPGIPSEDNTLHFMEAGMGYWVVATKNFTITINGTVPDRPSMGDKWNLFSVVGIDPVLSEDYLVDYNWLVVYGWNSTDKTWTWNIKGEGGDLEMLELGRGYWVQLASSE